jgi:hypothetical protein
MRAQKAISTLANQGSSGLSNFAHTSQADLAADYCEEIHPACSACVRCELMGELAPDLLLQGERKQSPMHPQAPFAVK